MPVPLAVDPSNPSPGLYLTVNLLRGTTSPGTAGVKALILTPPATVTGDIAVGTELRAVYSADDIETAAGKCPGYFAAKALWANDPQALVTLGVCAESAGAAAAGTITFAGTPSANETYRVWIHGVSIDLTWTVGDGVTAARDAAVLAINAKSADLFAIASAGSGGVVNITARTKGPIGNDITLRVSKLAGTGGTLTASGAKLTSGTTEHDYTTILATAAGTEYDYILIATSNADAQSSSASSNPGRLKTHIATYKTGTAAKLQQGVYGSTGSISSAKTNAVAMNSENLEHVCSVNDESLPCELAGAELGDRMRRRRRESNANRVFQPLARVRGSADPVGDQPTDAERIDALNNGVTLIAYDGSRSPILLRPITTHSIDTANNQDRRAFDTSEIDALYDYAKDLRAALPQEFLSPDGQVKIAKNRVTGSDPLPAGVVEERDVRSFIASRTMEYWVPKGVIDGALFQAAIDDGSLVCEVNASDPTQLDVFVPAVAFKILAKIGLYVAKVG